MFGKEHRHPCFTASVSSTITVVCCCLLAGFFFPGGAGAETATLEEAERVCGNWLAFVAGGNGNWSGVKAPRIIDSVEIIECDTLLGWCFSISPAGNVVVPVLKEMPPVKSCSDKYDLDVSLDVGFPRLLKDVLLHRARLFVKQYGSLDAVQPDNDQAVFGSIHGKQWQQLLTEPDLFRAFLRGGGGSNDTEVGPLLTTSWFQSAPYNYECPSGYGGVTCYSGCVAMAAVQIMNHHEWPPYGVGEHTYWWDGDNAGGGTNAQYLSADFSDAYDWANMPDSCDLGCSGEEETAVAELSYEVGVAFEMDYGTDGSGTWTYYALTALPAYFRYDTAIDQEYRNAHSSTTWFDLVKDEINADRPILYRVQGHAIVCDGWRDIGSLDQYHMNYGWGNSYTTWWTLDNLLWGGIDEEYMIREIKPASSGMDVVMHVVEPDGSGDFPTIQAAIDGAPGGDIILLAGGTYTGAGNKNIYYNQKPVIVRGRDGPERTVIDCQNDGIGFIFNNHEDPACRLEGVTVTNGYANYGAGIFISESSPTIVDCIISGNTAYYDGGGIEIYNNSYPTIESCVISGNDAYSNNGGGIDTDSYSDPTIAGCFITGNDAANYGGGITLIYSTATITNCTISENSAASYGGAIYVNNYEGSTDGLFTNNTLSGNTADRGGAMRLYYSDMDIANCIMWGDIAPGGYPEIYKYGGSPTITYSDIQGGYAGAGNIDSDPLFVNPAGHDYHILSGSPCKDTGTDAGVVSDIDGGPRPVDAGYDMGSDEYGSPYADSDKVLNVLFWGETNSGSHPGTDILRGMGYNTYCSTSSNFLNRWVLRHENIDVVLIKAGREDEIPAEYLDDLNDYVARDGGTLIVQAPDVVGEIDVFGYYASPDIHVSVQSTGLSTAVTLVDESFCLGSGLPAGSFPDVTAGSTLLSDTGPGWDVVASINGDTEAGALTAEYGRGDLCYIAGDMESLGSTAMPVFVRHLFSCLGRRSSDANENLDILVYNTSSLICSDMQAKLDDLGYSSAATTDVNDLSHVNLEQYDILFFGYDVAPSVYQSKNNDIRKWVRFERGGLIVEDPSGYGAVSVFPDDAYGNYTVETVSVASPPVSCVISDYLYPVTMEITNDEIPKAYSGVSSSGGAWKTVAETDDENEYPTVLFSEYYSGNFCFTSGRLSDAVTGSGSRKFWTRLINKAGHPYKPLDDVLFAVADDEPTWIEGLLAATERFPGTDFEYHDARSAGTTPNTATLSQHDVVLAWSWDVFKSQASMGNNLKAYVDDWGRGVIVLGRAFDYGTGRELLGGLTSDADYLPFNPIAEENVQFIDHLNSAGLFHKFFLGKSLGEIQSIEDRFRANVELTSGAAGGVSSWDNDPVALCADTTELYQYVGGLAYNSGYLYGCDQDIVAPYEKPRFLRISPTSTGGEPVAEGYAPSAVDQVPEGLAYGGGYYWYTCSGPGELYRLSALDGTYDIKWSLGFVPGDLAYDAAGYLWIASPSENLIYQYDTGGSMVSSFSVSGYMDSPQGLALSGNELFTGGHTGSPQYTYGTIFVIDLNDTSAPVDSFPAAGYDAAGLAFEGSTRLWAIHEYNDPAMDGYNKVCGYESIYSNDPPGSGWYSRLFATINTNGGAVANKVAAVNAYPGDSADFLDDAAGGGHFADVLENIIEFVNIHPKKKDIYTCLYDPPKTIKRGADPPGSDPWNSSDILIEIRNLTGRAEQFRFRMEYQRISPTAGSKHTVILGGDPLFEIGPWGKVTGKLQLGVHYNLTEGDYSVTAYTRPGSSTMWNEKSKVIINVAGNVEFPAQSLGAAGGAAVADFSRADAAGGSPVRIELNLNEPLRILVGFSEGNR